MNLISHDPVITARQQWLSRQARRVHIWRRLRGGGLHGLAVALLIIGVGTTWYITAYTVEQLAQDWELADLRRDRDFQNLPVVEQQKAVARIRGGQWQLDPALLERARREHADLPAWRWGLTGAVLVVVIMGWVAGMLTLVITHSVARLLDRYPA